MGLINAFTKACMHARASPPMMQLHIIFIYRITGAYIVDYYTDMGGRQCHYTCSRCDIGEAVQAAVRASWSGSGDSTTARRFFRSSDACTGTASLRYASSYVAVDGIAGRTDVRWYLQLATTRRDTVDNNMVWWASGCDRAGPGIRQSQIVVHTAHIRRASNRIQPLRRGTRSSRCRGRFASVNSSRDGIPATRTACHLKPCSIILYYY